MYSIGEVSKMMNLSVSTLRYYDKGGVLPNVKRNSSGIREFDDKDLESLRVINCLKTSGLQLKDIKKFMEWCNLGDETIDKRLEMFNNQEKAILNQIDELNKALSMIKFKQWYYNTALKDKTEKNIKNMSYEDLDQEIKKLYENAH